MVSCFHSLVWAVLWVPSCKMSCIFIFCVLQNVLFFYDCLSRPATTTASLRLFIPEQFTLKAQKPLFPTWLSVVTWLCKWRHRRPPSSQYDQMKNCESGLETIYSFPNNNTCQCSLMHSRTYFMKILWVSGDEEKILSCQTPWKRLLIQLFRVNYLVS